MRKILLIFIIHIATCNIVQSQYLIEQTNVGSFQCNVGVSQIFKPQANAKIKSITVHCRNKINVNTFFKIYEGPGGKLLYSRENVILNNNSQATVVDLKNNNILFDCNKKYCFTFCLNNTCTVPGTGFFLDMEAATYYPIGGYYKDGWLYGGYTIQTFDSAVTFTHSDLKFKIEFIPPSPQIRYIKNYKNTESILTTNGKNIKWYLDELKTKYLEETDSLIIKDTLKNYFTFFATQNINGIESEISRYDIPYSNFSFKNPTCLHDTLEIFFNGNSTDSSKFFWNFNGANIISGTGKGPYLIKWEDIGKKDICLYIKDNSIISDTCIKSIKINPIPTSTFNIDKSKLCGSDTVLVTYTGTGSTQAQFNWNFNNGNIISKTEQNYAITWKTPGLKNLKLSVIEDGCKSTSNSKSISIFQPSSSFILDNVVCENHNTNIYFTGNASDSAIYYWNFSGANIVSGTSQGPYVVNWDHLGNKAVTLSINDNGCISYPTVQIIKNNPIPSSNIFATKTVCLNGVANIKYTGTATNLADFNWSFDHGYLLSGSGIGPYEVTWDKSGLKNILLNVMENGCSSDTTINLFVNPKSQPVSICMVGVDSFNHNMIVWEKSVENLCDSIIIYKETSRSNEYIRIGSQSAKDVSVFIDLKSNPAQNSSKYKISVLDTCGNETMQSEYHKTMHLTINAGIGGAWNLIWDKYEGFSYNTFHIYRGTSKYNMIKIAEKASNNFTYTDLTPPLETLFYQIEVVNPNRCNTSVHKSLNLNFESTRSNISSSNKITTIDDLSLESVEVYPNPVEDKLIINTINPLKKYTITILSLDGKELMNKKQLTSEIDVSKLVKGMYILRLCTSEKILIIKFMKR